MFCCFKNCMNGFTLTPTVPIRIKSNPVQLDTLHMGNLSFLHLFTVTYISFTCYFRHLFMTPLVCYFH